MKSNFMIVYLLFVCHPVFVEIRQVTGIDAHKNVVQLPSSLEELAQSQHLAAHTDLVSFPLGSEMDPNARTAVRAEHVALPEDDTKASAAPAHHHGPEGSYKVLHRRTPTAVIRPGSKNIAPTVPHARHAHVAKTKTAQALASLEEKSELQDRLQQELAQRVQAQVQQLDPDDPAKALAPLSKANPSADNKPVDFTKIPAMGASLALSLERTDGKAIHPNEVGRGVAAAVRDSLANELKVCRPAVRVTKVLLFPQDLRARREQGGVVVQEPPTGKSEGAAENKNSTLEDLSSASIASSSDAAGVAGDDSGKNKEATAKGSPYKPLPRVHTGVEAQTVPRPETTRMSSNAVDVVGETSASPGHGDGSASELSKGILDFDNRVYTNAGVVVKETEHQAGSSAENTRSTVDSGTLKDHKAKHKLKAKGSSASKSGQAPLTPASASNASAASLGLMRSNRVNGTEFSKSAILSSFLQLHEQVTSELLYAKPFRRFSAHSIAIAADGDTGSATLANHQHQNAPRPPVSMNGDRNTEISATSNLQKIEIAASGGGATTASRHGGAAAHLLYQSGAGRQKELLAAREEQLTRNKARLLGRESSSVYRGHHLLPPFSGSSQWNANLDNTSPVQVEIQSEHGSSTLSSSSSSITAGNRPETAAGLVPAGLVDMKNVEYRTLESIAKLFELPVSPQAPSQQEVYAVLDLEVLNLDGSEQTTLAIRDALLNLQKSTSLGMLDYGFRVSLGEAFLGELSGMLLGFTDMDLTVHFAEHLNPDVYNACLEEELYWQEKISHQWKVLFFGILLGVIFLISVTLNYCVFPSYASLRHQELLSSELPPVPFDEMLSSVDGDDLYMFDDLDDDEERFGMLGTNAIGQENTLYGWNNGGNTVGNNSASNLPEGEQQQDDDDLYYFTDDDFAPGDERDEFLEQQVGALLQYSNQNEGGTTVLAHDQQPQSTNQSSGYLEQMYSSLIQPLINTTRSATSSSSGGPTPRSRVVTGDVLNNTATSSNNSVGQNRGFSSRERAATARLHVVRNGTTSGTTAAGSRAADDLGIAVSRSVDRQPAVVSVRDWIDEDEEKPEEGNHPTSDSADELSTTTTAMLLTASSSSTSSSSQNQINLNPDTGGGGVPAGTTTTSSSIAASSDEQGEDVSTAPPTENEQEMEPNKPDPASRKG
ncbi:unnamed protein product [Amoebophrya sp. A120]|nr:unnamed protein product [Amoebophrya sp. A120]|eukprot:GSA120T00026134001.1